MPSRHYITPDYKELVKKGIWVTGSNERLYINKMGLLHIRNCTDFLLRGHFMKDGVKITIQKELQSYIVDYLNLFSAEFLSRPIKYGIIVGRMQPMHTGHQHIIDKVISDGLIPVVFLGSAQETRTEKNPYHPLERIHMVKLVYPCIQVFALDDADCWDEWYFKLTKAITTAVTDKLSEVTIYTHDKLEDLQDFTFRGIDYINESYSKMYHIDGMHTTHLDISDIPIRAKSIREDLEGNKMYLHPKVYEYIKIIKV